MPESTEFRKAEEAKVAEVLRRAIYDIDVNGHTEFLDLDAGPLQVLVIDDWRLLKSYHGYVRVHHDGHHCLRGDKHGVAMYLPKILELLPILRRRQLLDDIANV